MIKIAPSLLSADFSNLRDEIAVVEEAGADWLHIDVMDGRFVPNITMGPLVVDAIRPHTQLPLDVHLMIEEPERYIPAFAKAGADLITVHQEATVHLDRTVQLIKQHGIKAGVALNPATPVAVLDSILSELDLVLIMTVNPGFGGQQFIEHTLSKMAQVRQRIIANDLTHIEIEVDGGIHAETASKAVDQGASILVAGSAIFGKPDRKKAIQALQGRNG